MNCLPNRWLKECKSLHINNCNSDEKKSLVTEGSLVRFTLNLFNKNSQISHQFVLIFQMLDPNLAKSLDTLKLLNVPAGK